MVGTVPGNFATVMPFTLYSLIIWRPQRGILLYVTSSTA